MSAAAICALGLALAAASTIFTVVNGIFLRPLPFDDPERVVLLRTERQLGGDLHPRRPLVLSSSRSGAPARARSPASPPSPRTR